MDSVTELNKKRDYESGWSTEWDVDEDC